MHKPMNMYLTFFMIRYCLPVPKREVSMPE